MKDQTVNFEITENWDNIFNNLKTEFKGFDKALFKQFDVKKRKREPITLAECIGRTKQPDKNLTVGLDGSLLEPPIICLDIDNATIGSRLIELYRNPDTQEMMAKVLGNPLIVETATKDHLHLYYKSPTDSMKTLVAKRRGTFKAQAATRLGFQAEFGLTLLTFAGPQYRIIQGPTLGQVPELPKSLYPYNYVKDSAKKALVGRDGELVARGSRNNTFFQFFGKDSFDFNHLKLANKLCCQKPLDDEEVKTLSHIPQRNTPTQPALLRQEERDKLLSKTYDIFSFEPPGVSEQTIVRLRPGEPGPKYQYGYLIREEFLSKKTAKHLEKAGFNPDRAFTALRSTRTVPETVLYVSLIELEGDLFLDDELWIGKSLIETACTVLIKTGRLNVKWVENEKAFYKYDGRVWGLASLDELSELVPRISQSVCSFRNIGKSTDTKGISGIVKDLCYHAVWPSATTGFNFLNGSLILLPNKTVNFQPHKPQHNFRRLTKINYDPTRYLTPFEARFLLDFSNEQVYLLNILRLIIYFSLESGGNQIAAFITGDPGGSKSTLLSLIEKVVHGCSNVTNPNTLAQRFTLLSQVRGRNLIQINDLAEDAIKPESAAVLKKLISREVVVDEQKYGDTFEFLPQVFVMITTNFESMDFSAFEDLAIDDRLLVTPAPSIESMHRINDFIERLGQTSYNFSGIVNWALNISSEIPLVINRAGDLNNVISPAKTLAETFALERLVYQPDNFMSFKTLRTAFNAYVKEVNQASSRRKSDEVGVRKFAPLMRSFADRTSLRTPLVEARTSRDRGLKNVGLRVFGTDQGEATESANGNAATLNVNAATISGGQTPFELKSNERVVKALNQDPFKNHGFLMRDYSSSYYQQPPEHPWVELYSKISAKAVFDVSLKMIMESVAFDDYIPHSHLKLPGKVIPGPKVYRQQGWLQIPEATLRGNRCLISEPLPEGVKAQYAINDTATSMPILETSATPALPPAPPEELPIVSVTAEPAAPAKEESTDETNAQDSTKLLPRSSEGDMGEDGDKQGTGTPPAQPLRGPEPSIQEAPKKKGRKPKEEVAPGSKEKELLENENLSNLEAFEALMVNSCCSEQELNPSDGSLPQDFRKAFGQSKQASVKTAQLIEAFIVEKPLQKYNSFKQPYPSFKTVINCRDTFLYFPLFGPLPLIKRLNLHFLDKLNRAFTLVREIRKPPPSDYFSRTLPGTNTKTKEIPRLGGSLSKIPEALTKVFEGYTPQVEWSGQSLLPLAYQKGDKSYGRFKSIPSSTMSTIKSEIKGVVLKTVSKATGLQFVELDMRAAHTLIFKAVAELTPEERAKFPSVDKQWSYLVESFNKLLAESAKQDPKPIKDQLLTWGEGRTKGLIKTQWYKALNAGSLFNPKDTINNNKNKLGLTDSQTEEAILICQSVFKQIDIFNLLSKFQVEVNDNKYIYLPTQEAPFDTSTLSKSQAADSTKQGDSKPHGMTGMSRIFSTCELVLIILVFISLARIDDVVPIAYEADGLLLAGYFKDRDKMLQEINAAFNPLAKGFLEEEVSLEFKNPT